MRPWMVIAAGLGIGTMGTSTAWAESARPTPEMLVLGKQSAPAPTILRGSAVQPKGASTARQGLPTEIVAGRQLWLVDRTSGEVQSCIDRDTSTVGVREIRCTSGDVGRYRRNFGPSFKP